jgi:hypothetical protein
MKLGLLRCACFFFGLKAQRSVAQEGCKLRFPNLVWAIRDRRLPHYKLALQTHIERTRLSRCMNGQFEFAPHEKTRIAEVLRRTEDFLFAEPQLAQTKKTLKTSIAPEPAE